VTKDTVKTHSKPLLLKKEIELALPPSTSETA